METKANFKENNSKKRWDNFVLCWFISMSANMSNVLKFTLDFKQENINFLF